MKYVQSKGRLQIVHPWLFIFLTERLNCVSVYKTLLSEQQIREVTEIIRTDQDLHMKILIKSLFVLLPQWFRSTQQDMLKRKGRLEDFSANSNTESLRSLYTK